MAWKDSGIGKRGVRGGRHGGAELEVIGSRSGKNGVPISGNRNDGSRERPVPVDMTVQGRLK